MRRFAQDRRRHFDAHLFKHFRQRIGRNLTLSLFRRQRDETVGLNVAPLRSNVEKIREQGLETTD